MTYPYCECGCGQITNTIPKTTNAKRQIVGQHYRFIYGHSGRGRKGPKSYQFLGRKLTSDGYVLIYEPNHKRADRSGYVKEHILIIERALGKEMPEDSQSHHFNENRSDNSRGNIILCENLSYHKILHKRLRAFKACGHAHWRKCYACQKYDDPSNLHIGKENAYHRECLRKKYREEENHEEGIKAPIKVPGL